MHLHYTIVCEKNLYRRFFTGQVRFLIRKTFLMKALYVCNDGRAQQNKTFFQF